MDDEPKFENWKQRQNYYKEKYKNRGKTVWVSKRIGRDGKVIQPGKTYVKPKERIVHKSMKDVE